MIHLKFYCYIYAYIYKEREKEKRRAKNLLYKTGTDLYSINVSKHIGIDGTGRTRSASPNSNCLEYIHCKCLIV